jgi:hypothetical protein
MFFVAQVTQIRAHSSIFFIQCNSSNKRSNESKEHANISYSSQHSTAPHRHCSSSNLQIFGFCVRLFDLDPIEQKALTRAKKLACRTTMDVEVLDCLGNQSFGSIDLIVPIGFCSYFALDRNLAVTGMQKSEVRFIIRLFCHHPKGTLLTDTCDPTNGNVSASMQLKQYLCPLFRGSNAIRTILHKGDRLTLTPFARHPLQLRVRVNIVAPIASICRFQLLFAHFPIDRYIFHNCILESLVLL